MTGAEIDRHVQAACDQHRAVHPFHFRDARRVTAAGWPDWVLLGPAGILFAEVKGRGDRVSGKQRAVGYALQAVGLPWQVWSVDQLGADFLLALITSQVARLAGTTSQKGPDYDLRPF